MHITVNCTQNLLNLLDQSGERCKLYDADLMHCCLKMFSILLVAPMLLGELGIKAQNHADRSNIVTLHVHAINCETYRMVNFEMLAQRSDPF